MNSPYINFAVIEWIYGPPPYPVTVNANGGKRPHRDFWLRRSKEKLPPSWSENEVKTFYGFIMKDTCQLPVTARCLVRSYCVIG